MQNDRPTPPLRQHGGGYSSEVIHEAVSLPTVPARNAPRPRPPPPPQRSTTQRQSTRQPGGAVRAVSSTTTPQPVPPPRPASTITPFTRDLLPHERERSFEHRPIKRSNLSPPTSLSITQQQPAMVNLNQPALSSVAGNVPVSSSGISLDLPRPPIERRENHYVETTNASAENNATNSSVILNNTTTIATSSTNKRSFVLQQCPQPSSSNHQVLSEENKNSSKTQSLSTSNEDSSLVSHNLNSLPGRAAFGYDSDSSDSSSGELQDSIICRHCGKCKCKACHTPKPLPDKWLCSNTCHLSAETVVDTCSCMWLVKAGLYHCDSGASKVRNNPKIEEDPCWFPKPGSKEGSCSEAVCRLSTLGLLSTCLPCLLCYLPLKGLAKLTEKSYQKCTMNGCDCPAEGLRNGGNASDLSRFSALIQSEPKPSSFGDSTFQFGRQKTKQATLTEELVLTPNVLGAKRM